MQKETNAIHIAIIPDGNRRWAKARGLMPWEGHRKAVENFRSITEFCRKDPRIAALTVWCFSTENWKRDQKEIAMLMELLEKYLRKESKTFLEERTRFVHAGRKDRLPKSLVKLIEEVEDMTAHLNEFTLQLAVDYGGKDELLRAMERTKGQPVDEEHLREGLDHPDVPDIDLIIRTSGEIRTSNFFLWQSAYAEWVFLEKHFPDFGAEDVEAALTEFDRRTRRFGG